MKRRTVLISKINDDHTGFVKNVGIDELSLFKKLKDNGVELKDEGNISDGEICMLLRHCCVDGFVEGVFSIENHFNRDQKQINILKDNVELDLKSKGLTIVTHCEWQPSFNYDYDVINKRNYLTILCENINRKQNEYDDLEYKYNKFDKEFEDYKIEVELEKQKINKSLETYESERKEKIESEIKSLEEIITENTEKIKRQNWYLQKTKEYEQQYNYWKEKFDSIIERYKNGLKKCEEQENNAKEKWPDYLKKLETDIKEKEEELKVLTEQKNEIENNINELQPQLKYIENRLSSYESELDSILNKYI